MMDHNINLRFSRFSNFFTAITDNVRILAWKSKGLSTESIKPPTLSDNRLISKFKMQKWQQDLKEDVWNKTWHLFTCWNMVNLLSFYKLDTWSGDLNSKFTLGHSLFWVVKLTKNVGPKKVNIALLVLNLMHIHNFHSWLVDGVKMLLFLV